jgi:uncharacterized protein YaiL (DUF2058 family)
MSDSLRDQLMGLGFKPAPKPAKPAHDTQRRPQDAPRKPQHPSGKLPTPHKKRSGGEMDLAKAYAIRAHKEKDERIAAESERQAEAARKREGKLKLAELLKASTLNDAKAEIARHFEYGGKIRRIYVSADQLKALNAGALGVVQQGGRYHLVTVEHALAANELLPGVLALLVDPNAPAQDDQYADPKYQVPDDLVW